MSLEHAVATMRRQLQAPETDSVVSVESSDALALNEKKDMGVVRLLILQTAMKEKRLLVEPRG